VKQLEAGRNITCGRGCGHDGLAKNLEAVSSCAKILEAVSSCQIGSVEGSAMMVLAICNICKCLTCN
jgi:hypothetical protein